MNGYSLDTNYRSFSLSHFLCDVQSWPSSSRAEATVILTVLLTVPREKYVIIFTDSQNCIDTFLKIFKKDSKLIYRCWLKINNRSIWYNILDITRKKIFILTSKK